MRELISFEELKICFLAVGSKLKSFYKKIKLDAPMGITYNQSSGLRVMRS